MVLLCCGGLAIHLVHPRPMIIRVSVGPDGSARLFGIPLGRGGFRRSAFWMLAHTPKTQVGLAIRQENFQKHLTNVTEISAALNRAGVQWIPRPANPYE